MARRIHMSIAALPLSLLFIALGGCAGMGSLADILAAGTGVYGGGNEVTGEIRTIDTRRQEIEIESGWGGGERIRYDGRTQVVYQQRRYDVRDLERGDYVRVRFDGNGDSNRDSRYASSIQVQQSVRDQGGRASDRMERVEGRVMAVDSRQGWFEIEQSWGSNLVVTLPYDPDRNLEDRFRRLRRGDRVRVEGLMLSGSRMEVYRFL